MKIVTNSYTNATYTRRTSPNAPQATKPVPVVSDAIRPMSNSFMALDGKLPPLHFRVDAFGKIVS